MTADEIRAALKSAPFRPFKVRIADGRAFDIRRPDFLLLTPGGQTAFVCESDEVFSIVDVMLMTEIEYGYAVGR